MAKKKGDGAKPGKGKTIGIAVAMLVVGGVVGPKLLGGGAQAAPTGETGVTTTTAPGPVVPLAPITVNLADGHILKVGLALQLAHDAKDPAEGGGGHGGGTAEDDPTKGWAPAMDIAIAVFGQQSYDGLLASGGRETARTALEEQLHHHYPEVVEGVYFYEFIMQ